MPPLPPTQPTQPTQPTPAEAGPSIVEVWRVFLRLGLTSFGGPVAHLGFFRTEFVERRRWIDDRAWADLVALCQFLPGPASSQAGFAMGLHRAGWRGGLAAWAGFTLPSALVMVLAAWGLQAWAAGAPSTLLAGVLQGLKAAVVAVVVQAVLGMARSLCPDRRHALIGFAAAVTVLLLPAWGAWLAMGLGAMAGRLGPTGLVAAEPGVSPPALTGPRWRPSSLAAAGLWVCWLLGLVLSAWPTPAPQGGLGVIDAVATVWRSGALVFGGGHVVLPLLEPGIVDAGLLPGDTFLAGYAAAQAVPGPMFTLAAFLGAAMAPASAGVAGSLGAAALLLGAIFLPGLLLVAAAWPWWQRLSGHAGARRTLGGLQAAVVGVLGAACYDPVFTAGVRGPVDAAVAVGAFALLTAGRVAPPWVMALAALAGAVGSGVVVTTS